jgi:hypothetical protein
MRRPQHRNDSGDCEHAPMPAGHESDRKQQAEMRLEGQEPDEHAGERRSSLDQHESAADEPRSEESVLADDEVREHRRERGAEEVADAIADDDANRSEVDRKRPDGPDQPRGRIGDERQCGGDEQESRRIVPAEVAFERMADRGLLDKLVRRPVVDCSSVAGEHHAPGRPDVDEIGRHAAAVAHRQPAALDVACGEVDHLRHDEREADKFNRPCQLRAGTSGR